MLPSPTDRYFLNSSQQYNQLLRYNCKDDINTRIRNELKYKIGCMYYYYVNKYILHIHIMLKRENTLHYIVYPWCERDVLLIP